MSVKDDILVMRRTRIPTVPFHLQLWAQLVMCGAEIVPDWYWDDLGRVCKNALYGDDSGGDERFAPFAVHKNHVRSDQHDLWQSELVKELADPLDNDPDRDVYFVPVNELAGDDEYIKLVRLSFTGTFEEMESAVVELISRKWPDEETEP